MFRRLLNTLRATDPDRPAGGDPITPSPLIHKVAKFVACEIIEGDYLEFGVYRGQSFIGAYQALQQQFERRIRHDAGGEQEGTARAQRQAAWDNMRFFAFDSFEGLPALTAEDLATQDFAAGQYACSVAEFQTRISAGGIAEDRVRMVPGWFEQTCTAQTIQQLGMRKAAVIWIDADLYSSTRAVLSFVTDLLQDGTVLIFDDWFSYRGSPYQGEQRAFREWAATIADRFTLQEYQRESWKRMSFIASRRPRND